MAGFILLSSTQMRAAEAAAIKGGVSSAALMEKAGGEVAAVAMRAWTKRPVAVLCGPGNNGGDGFVAARRLAEAGWPVRIGLIGERAALKGDAKLMADLYDGEIETYSPAMLEGAGLIIDAVFGTGLARKIEGGYASAIEAVNANAAPALAVDIPSGVNADTGAAMGVAVNAARTVTFFQKKPGHVLFPGRALCGAVDVVDIGITTDAVADIAPDTFENQPPLWGASFGRPTWQAHKYHRGHVFAVSGGPISTGAIRLAAMGALRIGAGLVTVLASAAAARVHANHLTAIMLHEAETHEEIILNIQGADQYKRIVVFGPAAGVGEETRAIALSILQAGAGAVFDADALTSFDADPAPFFEALRGEDVLTPHTGEFARLFPDLDAGADKLAAAR
ncbi:MAG: NAD(P)H-hydrate epimerase, partial [Hyphococcus sp.]